MLINKVYFSEIKQTCADKSHQARLYCGTKIEALKARTSSALSATQSAASRAFSAMSEQASKAKKSIVAIKDSTVSKASALATRFFNFVSRSYRVLKDNASSALVLTKSAASRAFAAMSDLASKAKKSFVVTKDCGVAKTSNLLNRLKLRLSSVIFFGSRQRKKQEDLQDLQDQLRRNLKPLQIEAPVVEAPVVEAPVVEAPVVEAPVVEAPVQLRRSVRNRKSPSRLENEYPATQVSVRKRNK
jgi:hypothetical protein